MGPSNTLTLASADQDDELEISEAQMLHLEAAVRHLRLTASELAQDTRKRVQALPLLESLVVK